MEQRLAATLEMAADAWHTENVGFQIYRAANDEGKVMWYVGIITSSAAKFIANTNTSYLYFREI